MNDYKVEFDIPSIYAKTFIGTGSQGMGLASASSVFEIKSINTRNVYITSNIETSYKKVSDLSQLPIKVEPDGSFSIDESKLRPSTPLYTFVAPPSPPDPNFNPFQAIGPWAVQIERVPNTPMTVASVAQWVAVPNASPAFRHWLGGVVFTAHTDAFDAATSYQWTLPPDSVPNTTNSPAVRDFTAAPPNSQDSYHGIKLGSQANGSDLTTNSSVYVQATDSDGSLSDSYNVNWHLPVEDEQRRATYPRADQEVRNPVDFRQGDVALEVGSHLNAKFRLGTLWYLQDFITGFGKGFQGGSQIGSNEKLAFLLEKIGELIENIDLGAEQSTNCPFTPNVYARSKELGLVDPDLDISNAKMTYPYIVFYYDVHAWDYDAYDGHGYRGREQKFLRKPTDDSPFYAGNFERKSYTGDEQPNGG
jgi:hypothetical protein